MCSGFILSSLTLSSHMDNAVADNNTDHVACQVVKTSSDMFLLVPDILVYI